MRHGHCGFQGLVGDDHEVQAGRVLVVAGRHNRQIEAAVRQLGEQDVRTVGSRVISTSG